MTDERSPTDPRTSTRYACIQDGAGDYIIYDTTNPNEWIQSDTVIQFTTTRSTNVG